MYPLPRASLVDYDGISTGISMVSYQGGFSCSISASWYLSFTVGDVGMSWAVELGSVLRTNIYFLVVKKKKIELKTKHTWIVLMIICYFYYIIFQLLPDLAVFVTVSSSVSQALICQQEKTKSWSINNGKVWTFTFEWAPFHCSATVSIMKLKMCPKLCKIAITTVTVSMK